MTKEQTVIQAARQLSARGAVVFGGLATLLHFREKGLPTSDINDLDLIVPADIFYRWKSNQRCQKVGEHYEYRSERLKIDIHSEFEIVGRKSNDVATISNIRCVSWEDLIAIKMFAINKGAKKSNRYKKELVLAAVKTG